MSSTTLSETIIMPEENTSTQSSIPAPCLLNTFSLMQASTLCKRKQTSVVGYLPKKLSVNSKKKKIDYTFMKLFINDFQPFKIVEDSGLKEFVEILNPNYKLPSRKAISNEHIPAMYQKCLVEVKEHVSTVESACLNTDCWTSKNNESFMAITIHFIDAEFMLKSVLLSCNSFNNSHTGNNLCQEILRVLDSWQLNFKIQFSISDNAYNIKKCS